MNKLWNWLVDRLWPFSTLGRLRRELALSRSIHDDYRQWSERWYALCHRELSPQQMAYLNDRYNQLAESECAAIGAANRIDKARAVFPLPGTGEIDPKLGEMGRALAEAAKRAEKKG